MLFFALASMAIEIKLLKTRRHASSFPYMDYAYAPRVPLVMADASQSMDWMTLFAICFLGCSS